LRLAFGNQSGDGKGHGDAVIVEEFDVGAAQLLFAGQT
jgi:hypothetical protein